ncbi:(Fe-S)-binding protein [Halodesulfovibrio marinisediminis]|uniref:Glycolate oxidase iron-sulfur subunit n=1 Tax=Halodesulfovibrio marinisediminis DSM 17456 TaxID=1121457 RepID=A0A1N6HDX7_9BACT|nr:(Fe-S)-binding protein [Halodesulfovibrio marinisediminis]SIO17992.1 glycolate oxidase iron-sulfur subunit [Halodesulfovibrio marinisediminis DSM 17456]
MTHENTKNTHPEANAPAQKEREAKCILCGKCASVCPVFLTTQREELTPKAKQRTIVALKENKQKLNLTDCNKLAEMCLSCGKCAQTCPQGLNFPRQLANMRAAHSGWRQWVWKRWVNQGNVLWPMLSTLSKAAPDSKGKNEATRFVQSIQAMQSPKDIPEYVTVARYDKELAKEQRVLLFSGCTASRVQKNWKRKSESILKNLGYQLLQTKGLTCCGLTLDHAGIPDAAHKSRMQNLRAWRVAERPLIVTFCATCYLGLAEYANDDSLDWAEGEKEAWKKALRPLSTLWGDSLFTVDAPAHLLIRYHQPCHWHGKDADYAWLKEVLYEEISAPDTASCCGMGGIAQLGNRKLTRTVANRCWENLLQKPPKKEDYIPCYSKPVGTCLCDLYDNDEEEEGQDLCGGVECSYLVITGCSGCTLQLRGTAPVRNGEKIKVGHWLDIIEP